VSLLSEPTFLFTHDLNQPGDDGGSPAAGGAAQRRESLDLEVTAAGILNCAVSWYTLGMGSAGEVSFEANAEEPRHMYVRGVQQRLHFLGYVSRSRFTYDLGEFDL
jgi:hypothetical protein